ncbi:hypothetical protein NSK_001390 [Nannochloropsis salina CCMP1776]|nr:hypothetical protein NSK_001390 [Nannochloropsis salina CCMP1776]|eukprot:TFJ87056.1 hypothetical protein NSK_001390 [Nannochloropsis salina CCMP1776]
MVVVMGMTVVRGDSADLYAVQCAKAFGKALKAATTEIESLKGEVAEGKLVSGFGARADGICNTALSTFAMEAPDADRDPIKVQIHDKQVEELEKSLDPPLNVLFIRQLLTLRDKALQRYKTQAKGTETSDYEAMQAADAFFTSEAEACLRAGSDWDYAAERASLQQTMNFIAQKNKKLLDVKSQAAQTQQQTMALLQQQQSQMMQLQNALGGGSPLNFGLSYRIPDTNINVQYTFQQGKTNVQFTCIPDDQAPFLGPQGFTHGIGPGNLGVTVNLNV